MPGRAITPAAVAAGLALAAVLVTAGAGTAVRASAPQSAASPPDALDRLFASVVRPDAPGCSVGVSRTGEPRILRGYGLASLEWGVPIAPDSVFHVASISKQFTAMSILLLAEDGKLSLDDEVRRHVPEWSDRHGVTLRHLLTHTSGIRDAFLLIELAAPHDGSVSTTAQLVRLLARQRDVDTTPGTEFRYDNGAYLLLGDIVRRVSGQSLAAFAEARIFRPLGMTRTHFHDDVTVIVTKVATGYSHGEHGPRLSRAPGDIVGNAGLFTTAGDLLTWEENFGAHPVVGSPATIAAMQTAHRLSTGAVSPYGLGLFVERHRGLDVTTHGGNDPGASAYVMRVRDGRLAVAVLCNDDSIDAPELARGAAALYLGAGLEPRQPQTAAPAPAPATSLTPAQLEAHAGLYRDPTADSLLRLFVRDGVLMGSPGAGTDGGWAVTPIDPQHFSIPSTPIVLEFLPATARTPQRLRVVGERPVPDVLERLDPYTALPAALASLAGLYRSRELDTTYAVTATREGLSVAIPGRAPIQVTPIFADGFAGPLVGTLHFTRRPDGAVDGLTLTTNGARRLRFDRQSMPTAGAAVRSAKTRRP